ncbi:MAG: DUF4863 family protein [Betaproteobacteria bacterium]|nr:DUF4863 family protein [Betaproteobacteria bacterium]
MRVTHKPAPIRGRSLARFSGLRAMAVNSRTGNSTKYTKRSTPSHKGRSSGVYRHGIRFSRPFKPSDELHGFSVDVVDMHDIAGPHHRHPHGEIDLIMPLDDGATFDHHGAGWLVCPPGTAHRPTVRNGRALVLYLLPDGAIEFSG